MKLKKSKENQSGLNTEFINADTGRIVELNHAIEQINKGNPNYKDYMVSHNRNTTYIKSKPDKCKKNNIE